MPTLTLAIPEDLKKEMDSMPEMNWSEIARKAIQEKAAEYKLFRSIVAKSKLKKKDARELADRVNDAMYRKYTAMYEEWKKQQSVSKHSKKS
jgi:hypothetical protein